MADLPRPLPPPTWRDRFDGLPDLPIVPLLAGAIAVLAVAVAAIVVVASQGGGGGGPDVALSLPRADTPTAGDSTTATTTSGPMFVHAAGAVANPGVVTVPGGARVTDVVAAAGGPAPDADLDQVNLAAPVADGERVYIPRQGEAVVPAGVSGSTSGGGAATDAILNLNTADKSALESLPGVGPATAQAILDYRSEHGRFRSVDDLLNVRGIGPAKLDQIKPHVRV